MKLKYIFGSVMLLLATLVTYYYAIGNTPVKKMVEETRETSSKVKYVSTSTTSTESSPIIHNTTFYQEFVGTVGSKPMKLYLIKNKLYTGGLYLGTLCSLAGDDIILLKGELEFVKNGKEAVGISNMDREIEYRKTATFDYEQVSLLLDVNQVDKHTYLIGKMGYDGSFKGIVTDGYVRTDSFNFKEVKTRFYPQIISCETKKYSLDGIVPRKLSTTGSDNFNYFYNMDCLACKERILFDSSFVTELISKEVIDSIYSFVNGVSVYEKNQYSFFIAYAEKNKICISVNSDNLDIKGRDVCTLKKWINYDLNTKKIVELKDIFKNGFETPLTEILNKKMAPNSIIKLNNFMVLEKGIAFMFQRDESSIDTFFGQTKTFFVPYQELKDLMQ
jgi:hypothetical protein